MKASLGILVGVALSVGCVNDAGRPLGKTDYGSGSFALENSNREEGILRVGDSLRLFSTAESLQLRALERYRFRVDAVDGDGNETQVSEGDVVSQADGSIPPTTLAHDIGDMAGATEGDAEGFNVSLWDPDDLSDQYEAYIPLLRIPALQGGWNVEEVDPPHVFATNGDGTPTNSFAVSDDGVVDPGETPGPVYVGGDGLPDFMARAGSDVDVYIVRDRDTWQNLPIPQAGEQDHVAGPIQVAVREDGSLQPTQVWQPTVDDVGIYDTMVDVDQDGIFDFELGAKDGVDGEAKVGLTIQFSQAWVRARQLRHIVMNIAFNSESRGGEWSNTFGADDPLYLYVNPDVTVRPDLNHKMVYKWVVQHQDFDNFWNANLTGDGCVDFGEYVIGDGVLVPAQEGCTNSSPLCVGEGDNIMGAMNGPGQFDVVFTFKAGNGNGEPRYCPGVDILDITSVDTAETLINITEVPLEQRVGFTVQ